MESSEPVAGMPRDLLLVRHGHSEGNLVADRAKQGDHTLRTEEYRARSAADYRLSCKGTHQAERAGEWIRAWLAAEGGATFDSYYCSPFIRARETAAWLGIPRAEWQLEPLLRERDWGLWEGLDRSVITYLYPISTEQKHRNKFLWRPECGENTPDVDLRTREMLATFARELPGKRVICVTHEDVMWALRFRLEKMTVEEWIEHEAGDNPAIVNCAVLHYTRVREDGTLAPKFSRFRIIDASKPETADKWTEITRPRFSDAELWDQVLRVPPLWDGEHARQEMPASEARN